MASDLVTLRHIKILAQPGLADIARSSEYGQEVDRGERVPGTYHHAFVAIAQRRFDPSTICACTKPAAVSDSATASFR